MDKYRMIIADDEKLIRESLTELIPWDDLGFEVVLCAEDGIQVIDYLGRDQVDIVLTDIQMRNSTGLDIAQYIYESKRDITVVLLSGYQEFDLAKKAIAYNVKEYLLKPISISGIRECFIRLKEEMDEKEQEQRRHQQMERELEGYKFNLMEKFFELGRIGAIKDEKAVKSYFETAGLGGTSESLYCCTAKLTLMHLREYECLAQDILTNIFKMLADKYGFYYIYVFVEVDPDNYQIIGLAEQPIEADWISDAIGNLDEICGSKASLVIIQRWMPFLEYMSQFYQDNRLLQQYQPTEHLTEGSSVVKAFAKQFLLILNMTDNMEEIIEEFSQILFDSTVHMRRSGQIHSIENIIKCMLWLMENQGAAEMELEHFDEKIESLKEYFKRYMKLIFNQLHQEAFHLSMEKQIKKLILANISTAVSLKEAAEAVFLSPNYFSRVFREQTGKNFSEFCIEVKMEKAVELLKQPQYKVYEISDYLGYKNIKYYYKLFKRVYHCTPSEYREKLKLNGE